MKPAAAGAAKPPSPSNQPPLQLLRWQARTQVFYEELGDGAQLTMVRIPAGSFQMGSAEQEPGRKANEGPVHEVKLAEFLIGQTPITQAQWRAVAGWQERPGERWGCELNPVPSRFQGEEARLLAGETNTDGRPVERVSWLEAMEFCSRLSQRTKRNYTLPSEAQWEYACRAGTETAYCFGDSINIEVVNFERTRTYGDEPTGDGHGQTTSVKLFAANPWGLYDMHGNVLEWCVDHWHDNYEDAPADGSSWLNDHEEESGRRLMRGGSWNVIPRECRSAYRDHSVPGNVDGDIGFRVVCFPQAHLTTTAGISGRKQP
jgi:formylglycine-generating enzyme required for sulfatase activity